MYSDHQVIACDVMVCTIMDADTRELECYGMYVRTGLCSTWEFIEWHHACEYASENALLAAIGRGVFEAVT